MADGREKLKTHIFGLRSMIETPELQELSKSSGRLGVTLIDKHVREGRFFGGRYRNKAYSTANLPMFFFGEWRYVKKTGNLHVAGTAFNRSDQLIKKQDVIWTKSKSGVSRPLLRGGYSKWLQYTRPGKNLNVVDLTYTGDMLRNLTFTTTVKEQGSEVRFFVRSPHDQKAAFTHAKRNWLGFFDDELDELRERAVQQFTVDIIKRTSVSE